MSLLPPRDRKFPTGQPSKSSIQKEDHGPLLITAFMLLGVAWIINQSSPLYRFSNGFSPNWGGNSPVLLSMKGGDPYVRALMRTISASESNDAYPYHILYGGEYVQDLSRHPDYCVEIVSGPNRGDCTTAAGRYQFLTTTWIDKAKRYHPQPPSWFEFWDSYSFEPEYQDQVVYYWLMDSNAWGVSVSELLKQGRINEVLKMLSGTWTSLGYGIETNSMSAALPRIYEEMLQEELKAAN
ncbi:MAG: glycoside hydrolase family protein [Leptolyngbyaceae cyanobacterium MO_188.B28]|nr:glycoside hydrolase family protein [Leptolyngbyaceae cyanobacterium MO_188.B28]